MLAWGEEGTWSLSGGWTWNGSDGIFEGSWLSFDDSAIPPLWVIRGEAAGGATSKSSQSATPGAGCSGLSVGARESLGTEASPLAKLRCPKPRLGSLRFNATFGEGAAGDERASAAGASKSIRFGSCALGFRTGGGEVCAVCWPMPGLLRIPQSA